MNVHEQCAVNRTGTMVCRVCGKYLGRSAAAPEPLEVFSLCGRFENVRFVYWMSVLNAFGVGLIGGWLLR